ncbi:MAG: GH92 family glycosyl hydrolase [Bacteroidota bacterium]
MKYLLSYRQSYVGNLPFLVLLLLVSCQSTDRPATKSNLVSSDLVQYVNTLMGTDSKFRLSNGNTYQAIATPCGMNFWTPITSKMGDGWTYKYDEEKIRGIKQTHQPSPWINDYAAFSLMPITGDLKFQEDERASWFSHKAEVAKPHHYSVYLADYDTKVEVSPTDRSAHFRFTFPDSERSHVIIDAFNKGSMVHILPEKRLIVGYNRNNSGGVPENFHNYFVVQFDVDFEVSHTWGDGWKLQENVMRSEGDHVGAIIGFKTKRGQEVHAKVASSFISREQAMQNLVGEIGSDTFEQTKEKAKKAWNKELQRIRVEDTDIANVSTFYSCLYRLLLFPRKFYEVDKDGEIVHYSPYNGEVRPGYLFTDNGFWDTFRAVFPFFTLMYPELNSQIMQGLVNTYQESGWLPEWASPGHRDCMIGSNSASLIADAYVKGVRGYDAEVLYEAMIKNATVEEGRPVKSVGREGVDYYNELGYVPYDVGINENTARTLEYAYADFAVGQFANALGKPEDAVTYLRKAKNYENVFDPATGWMRGKNEDGTFQSPFNPLKWGDAFTEGNSLHYTWSVFQDVQGLINLMGGNESFTGKLDTVFTMPPDFDDSYYGFTIHEIREMQIVNMGNYAHGNQPIQHMIYLYNYAGQPWKSQYRVRDVMNKLYSATPDGYCGDEDNGQTSAWYVFSALGFYPVTPGTTEYVMGSPLFDKVTLTMEDGAQFTIDASNNSPDNVYIKSAQLNGKPHMKTWVDHSDLQKGGTLTFVMSDKPNKKWGADASAAPFSLSKSEGP